MSHLWIKRFFALSAVSLMVSVNSTGLLDSSIKGARRYYVTSGEKITLNVYNSADYIAEDEYDDDGNLVSQGLISKFEDYCADELGWNVEVAYSTFDTNETMLGELQTGKSSYDLVCPSDYVIQKMIREDMLTPFDEGSTPNYDKYVSRFVNEKMSGIEVDGEAGLVSQYARGYMWGTLGILYNDGFAGVTSRGITESEMEEDMKDWTSLWDTKYETLLSIKDSMRDTYAVGIFYTFNDELVSLKEQYEAGSITADSYNDSVTEIFNRCDDETLAKVQENLTVLKDKSFGFEVDSGKTDMAKGDVFAINIAWSGDAAYAMDLADENNEANAEDESYTPTILKYSLPDTGANIWFDGWVMPKTTQNKEVAEAFVDFISMPDNVTQNMEYIGYTSVIAGDTVLELIQSWYDMRYDEESEEIDETAIEGYTEVSKEEISSLPDEALASCYYTKDISYFFEDTLEEHEISDAIFCLTADMKDRQFDTQYPDSSKLPSLAIMADFGTEQTDALLVMWEKVKNTNLPLWGYILVLLAVIAAIGLIIFFHLRRRAILKRRHERKEARMQNANKKLAK